jgi:hypothetical protein
MGRGLIPGTIWTINFSIIYFSLLQWTCRSIALPMNYCTVQYSARGVYSTDPSWPLNTISDWLTVLPKAGGLIWVEGWYQGRYGQFHVIIFLSHILLLISVYLPAKGSNNHVTEFQECIDEPCNNLLLLPNKVYFSVLLSKILVLYIFRYYNGPVDLLHSRWTIALCNILHVDKSKTAKMITGFKESVQIGIIYGWKPVRFMCSHCCLCRRRQIPCRLNNELFDWSIGKTVSQSAV